MKEIANALQEAKTLLEKIHSAYSESQGDISLCSLRKVIKVVNEALAEPIRNCDVGTAEEQYERWLRYCVCFRDCVNCPLKGEYSSVNCYAKWSQMPYESEVK